MRIRVNSLMSHVAENVENLFEHFGLSVFAFDAAHVVAAGFFAVDVHVLQR